jgi:hypothetical protein
MSLSSSKNWYLRYISPVGLEEVESAQQGRRGRGQTIADVNEVRDWRWAIRKERRIDQQLERQWSASGNLEGRFPEVLQDQQGTPTSTI